MRKNLPFFTLLAAVTVAGIAFAAAQTGDQLPPLDAKHVGKGVFHLKVSLASQSNGVAGQQLRAHLSPSSGPLQSGVRTAALPQSHRSAIESRTLGTQTGVSPIAPTFTADSQSHAIGRIEITSELGGLGVDTTLARRMQQVLDLNRQLFSIRGLSAAVFIPGRGVWLGTSGYSTAALIDSISPNTLFCMASNTKAFTSALTLKLVEDGRLSLDDSLGKYLPPMQYIAGSVTVRQLLNMTSGFFSIFNDSEAASDSLFSNPGEYWSPERVISTFVGPPPQPPGKSFRYSNTNLILIGMILRNITQSNLTLQFRQRILDPLGLVRTYFPPADTLIPPIAHPWHGGMDVSAMYGPAFYSMVWTAGTIYSTAENMVRWTAALYSGQVLLPSSMQQMQTWVPLVGWPAEAGGFDYVGYGLGIMKYSYYGKTIYGHDGEFYGYRSETTYHPGTGTAIVLLMNTTDANWTGASRALFETVSALWRAYFNTLTVPSTHGSALYAVSGSYQTGRLSIINPSNAHTSEVGATQYGAIASIAAHRNGKLLGVSAAHGWEVVQISPATGEAFPASTLTANLQQVQGIASESDSTLVVSEYRGGLYRVNIYTGKTDLISTPGIGFTALAVNPTGELWGSSSLIDSWGSLYRINPSTGDTSFKGSLGSFRLISGLAFDRLGNLFGVVPGQSSDSLIQIDTATCHAIVVGPLGITAVKSIVFSPDTIKTAIRNFASEMPDQFSLMQNYPNPFNPSTTIKYELPKSSEVKLSVYDILGREVATLVNERREAGVHEVKFDGSNLASGLYFYRLQVGDFFQTRKLMILK